MRQKSENTVNIVFFDQKIFFVKVSCSACRPLKSYECHRKQPLERSSISQLRHQMSSSGMRNMSRMQRCFSQVGADSLSLLLLFVTNPYTRFQATSLTRPKMDARAVPREGATVAEGWRTPSFREGLLRLSSAKG